jgi:hypothetical protein
MQQLNIDYFWPLTEQIPLDLNYTDCKKSQSIVPSVNSGQFVIANGGTWTTTIVASNLSLDVDTTTIKMKEKPGLCRRTILKCLGLKWEIK